MDTEQEIFEEADNKIESNTDDSNTNTIQKRSEEEIAEIKERVISLKNDANTYFNSQDYLTALNKYTPIIELANEIDFKEQLNEDKKAIECFSQALQIDSKYLKAIVNRMLVCYKIEEYIEALDDFNKLKDIDYSIYQKYRHMERELNAKAEIKKKQMTEEVMGKLKDVGNSFLGLFGLSTDNFKLQQGNGGGYSIQFQK